MARTLLHFLRFRVIAEPIKLVRIDTGAYCYDIIHRWRLQLLDAFAEAQNCSPISTIVLDFPTQMAWSSMTLFDKTRPC